MLAPNRRRSAAFTLIELLVVIGIIALLVGILIPTVSKVRISGYVTNTKAFMNQLEGAINRYHTDFAAYPGPVPNNECGYNPSPPIPPAGEPVHTIISTQTGRDLNRNMMGSENLFLGLVGGLWRNTSTPDSNGFPRLEFDIDRARSGHGPTSLNPTGLPKTYAPYVEPKNIFIGEDPIIAGKINGMFRDQAGMALNTEIPEFVDQFPAPMPWLYLRARVGAPTPTGTITATNNAIVTPAPSGSVPPNPPAQYDLRHIIGYTSNLGPTLNNRPAQLNYIGESKKLPKYVNSATGDSNNAPPAHGLRTVDPKASMDVNAASPLVYVTPYDAYAYFQSPTSPGQARNKDGYILISAGADRVYGTDDDICNFGEVKP